MSARHRAACAIHLAARIEQRAIALDDVEIVQIERLIDATRPAWVRAGLTRYKFHVTRTPRRRAAGAPRGRGRTHRSRERLCVVWDDALATIVTAWVAGA